MFEEYNEPDVDNDKVDPETGEILRPLARVYDEDNDVEMFVITPINSVSDILRFSLANLGYDVDDLRFEVEGIISQYERLKND